MLFPILGDSYTPHSKSIGYQKCVNLYIEATEKGKTQAALIGTPGSVLLTTVGSGPIRAIKSNNSEFYVISGDEMYKIDHLYNATLLGTMTTANGYAEIAVGIAQVMFVDGTSSAYYHTIGTGSASLIVDANFTSAGTIISRDGYFIYYKPDSDQVYNSALDDATTWSSTNVFSAIEEPDDIVTIESLHNELWIFGKYSTEVWYNAGNLIGSPFSKNNSARIDRGCAAKRSVVRADNTIFWLVEDSRGRGQLVKSENYVPQVISTPDIEHEFTSYTRIDDAHAYVYQDTGHMFYVITFPSANKTWVYDISNGLWHERSTFEIGRQRFFGYAYFNSRHCVGDYSNGNIYYLDNHVYDDNGETIKRVRSSRIFYDPDNENEKGKGMYNSFILDAIQIDFGEGVGLIIGQGSDPQVMLRYSKDESNTWSNELWRSIGKIAEFKNRVIWRRLGKFRDCTIEITITDPVPVVITGAEVKTRYLGV